MPVKNGERVYYKIEDGTIKTGIYENPKGKGRGRVKLAGGKITMPPKSALHHTRKGAMSEAFYDSSNKDPILGAKAGPAAAKEKAKSKNKKEKATPKKTPIKGTQKRSKMFPVSTTSSPDGNKVLLQNVMGIMADVGKDKGKSTQKEKDVGLTMDKKAREGKLTFLNFEDEIIEDEKTMDHMRGFESEMEETQGYNIEYWVSKVTKRDVGWDDLTEKQSERLQDIMGKDIMKMTSKKMKAFYQKFVKGKKFKSLKEIRDLFVKEYDEVVFKH